MILLSFTHGMILILFFTGMPKKQEGILKLPWIGYTSMHAQELMVLVRV